MAGDPEEMRARAALMSMQDRITRGPHSALNVPHNATPAEVRAAFLSLTKQYHPARFGRMAPEVQRLSNEVFLGIRSAHDTLAKNAAPRAQPVAPARPTAGSPALARTKTTPPGGTAVSSTTSPLPVTRPPAGRVAPASAPGSQPLPGRPQAAPLSPAVRPLSGPGLPAARPQSGPVSPRPTGAMPAARPAIAPASSPTGASRTVPTGPLPTARPAPQVAPRTAAGIPANPPASRPTSPGMPSVRAQPDPAPTSPVPTTTLTDQKEAATALDLLRRGHWSTARQLLQGLTGRVPASKSYRALLAYARGREALAAGRMDEAHDELQRALVLHPELDLAKAALAEHWSIHFPKK